MNRAQRFGAGGLFVLLTIATVATDSLSAGQKKKKESPSFDFYATAFVSGEASLPECTPVSTTVRDWNEDVKLEDANGVWEGLVVPIATWRTLEHFSTMRECLAAIPKYRGRYTEEHVEALTRGQLVAGMPFEFALMLLGPTDRPPSYVSLLNPLSGKPESRKSYVWVRLPQNGNAAAALAVVGGMFLGMAGTASNFHDLGRYLNLAAAAEIGEAVAWQSALSHAQVVTVQVDEKDMLTLVMAQ